MDFKKGDTITMKPGARSLMGANLGGQTGIVAYIGAGAHSLDATFGRVRYNVRPQDVETTPEPKYTPAQVTKALAEVKKAGGYCADFDRAVQVLRFLDLLDRLKTVATARGREDIYAELLKELEPKPEYKEGDRVHYTRHYSKFVLALVDGKWVYEHNESNPRWLGREESDVEPFRNSARKIINTVNLKPGRVYPKYIMPEVPKKGDYIKVTFLNGSDHTGEVISDPLTQTYGETLHVIYLSGRSKCVYVAVEEGTAYPAYRAVRVEQLPKPVKIPDIGKWIEATTHDGKTHTFEVTANKKHFDIGEGAFLQDGVANYNDFFVTTIDRGDARRRIVTWKYVSAPVVPVEIDGYWIARTKDNRVRAYTTEARAKGDRMAEVGADNMDDAYATISCYAADPEMRDFVPALLAIIKFIAREAGGK